MGRGALWAAGVVISLSLTVGCTGPSAQTTSGTKRGDTGGKGGSDHVHERGKMLIADAGKYHALLTAHLSPQGNELDIFFETAEEKNPAPVAIPMESFLGYARVAVNDE